MHRKVIFTDDCVRDFDERNILDKEIIKEVIEDIINKSEEYIKKIEEGNKGVIADEENLLLIKFYAADNTILITEVCDDINIVKKMC